MRGGPEAQEMVLEALGLEEGSKSLVTPGSKEDDKEQEDQGEKPETSAKERTEFRAVAARLNYMAMDMPDVQYACKEACRDMAAPTRQSWRKLKKLGRYLVGREAVLWRFPWKEEVGSWRVFTDSDWAGDIKTRRSTSGGIMMLGPHCLKSWSSTQSSPALSVCEAEYYALVDGATRVLGVQAAARELGIEAEDVVLEMHTDSSSAKSLASRRGLGRVRHIEVRWLWLQQAVAEGRFRLRKVLGVVNPADVCTKYLSKNDIRQKLKTVNIEVKSKGRQEEEGEEEAHKEG